MVDRRTFISTTAAFLGLRSLAAGTSPAKIARIGFLGYGGPSPVPSQMEAFRQALRELGWIENQTAVIEYRWAEGDPDRLPTLVGDLVRAQVDVIVLSAAVAIRAAQKVTSTVPVVFVVLVDPVELGFVSSLAHPGGNMTGLASQFDQIITKQLQLLKEAIPDLSRVALLRHSGAVDNTLAAAKGAAQSLGLAAWTLSVAEVAEFEGAYKAASSERADAVLVLPSPFFDAQHIHLIALATKYRLPAIYEFRNYVRDGGLMSYGPSINEMFRRAASYVDRILKGARPGELPVERPPKFELVVNLKTAAALGLRFPQSLLLQVDEVIT